MTTKDLNKNHFGILTSIDWNSNKWNSTPTDEDLKHTNFKYAKMNFVTYSFLNFGYDDKADVNSFHSALCPHIYSKLPVPEKRNSVKIIFMISRNYQNGKTYLIEYYTFPIIHRHSKISPIPEFCETLNLCIESKISDIVFFENYIDFSELDMVKGLPINKKLGKQGFNYINVQNTLSLLDQIDRLRYGHIKHRTNKRKILEHININRLYL